MVHKNWTALNCNPFFFNFSAFGCGTTGRAKEAEWRQNHCQVGSMVAVVAEWRHRGRHSDRSMVGQRRHNGGTRKAEASLKLIHNVHNSTHFLWCDQWPTTVHPFCDHGGVCASPLPPLGDQWATDLLGELCETVLNMLKLDFTATMASMAMSERRV